MLQGCYAYPRLHFIGPVVRWQPNMLLINDPTVLPKIYHLRANKTPHYNHSPSEAKGMVEENDWQKHREKRHRIDPAVSIPPRKQYCIPLSDENLPVCSQGSTGQ